MGVTKRVVYGEGEHPKIIRAAYQVQEEGIATPILLGDAETVRCGDSATWACISDPQIITPHLTDHEALCRSADRICGGAKA